MQLIKSNDYSRRKTNRNNAIVKSLDSTRIEIERDERSELVVDVLAPSKTFLS